MRNGFIFSFVFGCALLSESARAQPSETDKTLAQSLFDQAKALMDAGKYAEACPKFAESQRLDPGGGTLLNLALCHENEGKLATAWTEFKEALGAARRDGREERIQAAEEHIASLEPKLPWMTLSVVSPAEGQTVKLDGAVIGSAVWGAPVAIDPGAHELSATAPGRTPWKGSVTIAVAEKKAVTIPALAVPRANAPVGTEPAGVAPGPDGSADRAKGDSSTLGWIIGGAGIVSLGVGTFFGIQTLSKKKQSDDLCPTDTTCTKEGAKLSDEAHTTAWIANVGIGLGLVGIGVGGYLVLSTGGENDTKSVSFAGTF
jgi:hypothetical protein